MKAFVRPILPAGWLLAALLLAPGPVHADDLEVGLKGAAPAGRKPALLVTVHKPIRHLRVKLTRSDGGRVNLERRSLPVGEQVELPLNQPPGRFSWTGSLVVKFRDGTEGEMPLTFETVIAGTVGLSTRATREDVLARKVVLEADRPVRKVTVEVLGERGRRLGHTELPFEGTPAGTPLEIEWSQDHEGEPIKIQLTVEDTDGLTGGITWMPWQVDIPHEEVVFDTGKAEIRADQAPKLGAVIEDLEAAIDKYGSVVEVTLWIAGHTDTVGSVDTNRALSDRRAQAIGRWFRARDVRVPIRYRGFGEDALAVATPDDTDEARNRRAEYLIAAEDPYAGRSQVGTWKPLK